MKRAVSNLTFGVYRYGGRWPLVNKAGLTRNGVFKARTVVHSIRNTKTRKGLLGSSLQENSFGEGPLMSFESLINIRLAIGETENLYGMNAPSSRISNGLPFISQMPVRKL